MSKGKSRRMRDTKQARQKARFIDHLIYRRGFGWNTVNRMILRGII